MCKHVFGACVYLCVVYMSVFAYVYMVCVYVTCVFGICVYLAGEGGGGECMSNLLLVLFLLEPSPVQYLPLLSTCLFEGEVSYFYSQHKR